MPCTDNCKQLTDSEIKTIVELKAAFSKDVDEFRQILQNIDSGCPNKYDVDKQGHPLICYEENSGCTSSLRILRAASPHYPKLRTFLRNVYDAMKFDRKITAIDVALTVVWSRPFQVEREEGSGDTAIPNAFCWNAIISIYVTRISRALRNSIISAESSIE